MTQAEASIWYKSPHLFPGTTPLPLGLPALAGCGNLAFHLGPGHNEHELVFLALLQYMRMHGHPSLSDWNISSSSSKEVVTGCVWVCLALSGCV